MSDDVSADIRRAIVESTYYTNRRNFYVSDYGLERKIFGRDLYQVVLTKEEFVACYNAWIRNEDENDSK